MYIEPHQNRPSRNDESHPSQSDFRWPDANTPDYAAMITLIQDWAKHPNNAERIAMGKNLSRMAEMEKEVEEEHREIIKKIGNVKDWYGKNGGQNYENLYGRKPNESLQKK
jgi:hypothetical protein